jgi:hypothetical protein
MHVGGNFPAASLSDTVNSNLERIAISIRICIRGKWRDQRLNGFLQILPTPWELVLYSPEAVDLIPEIVCAYLRNSAVSFFPVRDRRTFTE